MVQRNENLSEEIKLLNKIVFEILKKYVMEYPAATAKCSLFVKKCLKFSSTSQLLKKVGFLKRLLSPLCVFQS